MGFRAIGWVVERLTGATVEQAELARRLRPLGTRIVDIHPDQAAGLPVVLLPAHERLVDVGHLGPVEHGRGRVDLALAVVEALIGIVVTALGGGLPEVGLQNLAGVDE